MIVAAPGGDQAELAGQGEQAGLHVGRLVRVEDLHPGQARGGQAGDLIIGDEQRAVRTRMGDDGDAARRADQADGPDRIQCVPGDVGAAAVGDPVQGEGLLG